MPTTCTVDLTVLRCVGWLARTDHPLRPHKIGPELATPGAQCLGQHRFRFAVRPFPAGRGHGHLYRAAEDFSVPLQAYAPLGRAPGVRPRLSLGLAIEPDDVVLSAVKTAEDGTGLLVRVFNSVDRPLVAVLRAAFPVASAERCDLEERSRNAVEIGADGSVGIPLAPAQIATVLLHPRYDERDPSEQEVGLP
jgi:mannosylglycerate hydrolase